MSESKLSKLPPSGLISIEIFNDKTVLTILRDDGKKLSLTLTLKELENLVEYIRNILSIAEKRTIIMHGYCYDETKTT